MSISKNSIVSSVNREGITILHNPPSPVLDLVFAHGLNGHPYRSWTDNTVGFYWPLQIADVLPDVRIMTFGYNADIKFRGNNLMDIREHAESMLVNLRNKRQGSATRPLAFICHSLGGLVVKQTMILSSRRTFDAGILASTKLVIFMGTPHRGSHLLDSTKLSLVEKLAKASLYEIPGNLKSALKPRANELFAINDDFSHIKRGLQIVNFYEKKPMEFLNELVVDKDSAVLHWENEESIPLNRDHRDLIRFQGAQDDAYRQVRETIERKVAFILDEISKTEDNKFISECLDSLNYAELENRLSEIAEPSDNTLKWLASDEIGFCSWLESERGIFWISGKPGSGKSTLMKEAYIQNRQRQNGSTSICVGHFFNNRGNILERSAEGLLRSILEQVLRQQPVLFSSVAEDVRMALNYKSNDAGAYWTNRALRHVLDVVLLKNSGDINITLFVDGLDECEGWPMRELVAFLVKLTDESYSTKVKVCFSGRNIDHCLDHVPMFLAGFILQEKNEVDITNFVNEKWATSMPKGDNMQELQHLKDQVKKKADGVFLWATLVLRELARGLEDGNTFIELMQSLEKIPSELRGLFDVLLSQVDDAYVKETNIMLSIVLSASRPLALAEFRHAVSHALSENGSSELKVPVLSELGMIKRIRSRCGGLLEVKTLADTDVDDNQGKNVVQLIHQSVKEYLISKTQRSDSRILDATALLSSGHVLLAQAALQYLSTEKLRILSLRLEKLYHLELAQKQVIYSEDHPFLDYSVRFWIQHCREAERFQIPQSKAIDEFGDQTKPYFDTWMVLYDWLVHFPSVTSNKVLKGGVPLNAFEANAGIMQVAVNHDLVDLVRYKIDHGIDVNEPVEFWLSYLHLASYRGHKDVVELLLNHGADVHIRSRSAGSVLSAACKQKNLEIIEILLQAGAETKTDEFLGSPIFSAAKSGHIEQVQRLFEYDLEAFASPYFQLGVVLCYSAGQFSRLIDGSELGRLEETARPESHQLQGSVSDPAVRNSDETESHAASFAQILRVISDNAVDMTLYGNRAVYLYWGLVDAEEQNTAILIEKNVDLSGRDETGLSFLHFACAIGKGQAAKIVIDHGFDPEICTLNGYTPLHLAARNKTEDTLRYLLTLDIDREPIENNGRTPLHYAAAKGSDAHLEILLNAGCKINVFDVDGFSPFHYAMTNLKLTNNRSILDRVSSFDGSILRPTHDGILPFFLAARFGSSTILKWFIGKGADVGVVDEGGRTLLHAAAHNYNDTTGYLIQLLKRSGVNALASDESGMTPLHYVFFDQFDAFGGGIFMAMVMENVMPFETRVCKTKIRLLLAYGANINAQDNCGNTVLHLACAKANRIIVRYLIDEGADSNLKDVNGCKPVDLARDENIRMVLEDE